MSHTITDRAEIPDALFYVLANDSFMSGWGPASGKTNTVVLPCDSRLDAEVVMQNAEDRSEMHHVRIVDNKPRLRPGVLYSLLTKKDSPLWFSNTRPFGRIQQ